MGDTDSDKDSSWTKYLYFDGEHESSLTFEHFIIKFNALANRKGFAQGLTHTKTAAEIQAYRTSSVDTEKGIALANDIAYHYFTICTGGDAFDYVKNAKTAPEALASLEGRYDTKEEQDIISLTLQWNECKPKSHLQDPQLWFAELEHIAVKIGAVAGVSAKTDIEKMVHIMAHMPPEYNTVKEVLNQKTTKTLAEVKKAYANHWKTEFKAEAEAHEGGEAYTILFKGFCYNCGEQGHRAEQCTAPKKKRGNWQKGAWQNKKKNSKPVSKFDKKKGKKKRACFNCGSTNHFIANCPKNKDKNKSIESFFVGCVDLSSDNDSTEAVYSFGDDDSAGTTCSSVCPICSIKDEEDLQAEDWFWCSEGDGESEDENIKQKVSFYVGCVDSEAEEKKEKKTDTKSDLKFGRCKTIVRKNTAKKDVSKKDVSKKSAAAKENATKKADKKSTKQNLCMSVNKEDEVAKQSQFDESVDKKIPTVGDGGEFTCEEVEEIMAKVRAEEQKKYPRVENGFAGLEYSDNWAIRDEPDEIRMFRTMWDLAISSHQHKMSRGSNKIMWQSMFEHWYTTAIEPFDFRKEEAHGSYIRYKKRTASGFIDPYNDEVLTDRFGNPVEPQALFGDSDSEENSICYDDTPSLTPDDIPDVAPLTPVDPSDPIFKVLKVEKEINELYVNHLCLDKEAYMMRDTYPDDKRPCERCGIELDVFEHCVSCEKEYYQMLAEGPEAALKDRGIGKPTCEFMIASQLTPDRIARVVHYAQALDQLEKRLDVQLANAHKFTTIRSIAAFFCHEQDVAMAQHQAAMVQTKRQLENVHVELLERIRKPKRTRKSYPLCESQREIRLLSGVQKPMDSTIMKERLQIEDIRLSGSGLIEPLNVPKELSHNKDTPSKEDEKEETDDDDEETKDNEEDDEDKPGPNDDSSDKPDDDNNNSGGSTGGTASGNNNDKSSKDGHDGNCDSSNDRNNAKTVLHVDQPGNTTEQQNAKLERWLLDTGATVHVDGTEGNRMRNVKESKDTVTVGNREKARIVKKGDLLLQTVENKAIFDLDDVMNVPGFQKNVISASRWIEQHGLQLLFDKNKLTIINKHGQKMVITKQPNESMFYLDVVRLDPATREEGALVLANEAKRTANPSAKKLDINEAHRKFAHMNADTLKRTYRSFNIELIGDLKPCDGCMRAKARAKNVPKTTCTEAERSGERLFLDATGPFAPSLGGSRFTVKLVDQKSRKTWGARLKRKSEIPAIVAKKLDELNAMGKIVKYVRCDNAGEHKEKLRTVCKSRGVQLEYTTPDTPQFNAVVERKIVTDRLRAHAMELSARLTTKAQDLLRAEAEATAEILSNIACSYRQPQSPNVVFDGKPAKLTPKHLVEWGRIGYVTIRTKIQKKWRDRAVKMIMVGYALDHTPDTYRMYNPETNKVILTRDVRWAEWKDTDPSETLKLFQRGEKTKSETTAGIEEWGESEKEQEPEGPHIIPPDGSNTRGGSSTAGRNTPGGGQGSTTPAPTRRVSTRSTAAPAGTPSTETMDRGGNRLSKELLKLQWNINDPPRERNVVEDDDEVVLAEYDFVEDGEDFVLATELNSDAGDPKTYAEAVNGPNGAEWRDATIKEIMNFINRGAWKKVSKEEVKQMGRKPIPSKLVFKTKHEHDGSIRFKVRIVCKGFKQIPGVDFTESYAPVAADSSVRTVIGTSLYYIGHELELLGIDAEWVLEMYDVAAAFLNADRGPTPLYMEMPHCMVDLGFVTEEEWRQYCIQLLATIYGEIAAAMLWNKKFNGICKDIGLEQCKSDPCVFYKRNEEGKLVLLMAIHTDDSLIGGLKEEVKAFMDEFEKRLKIERLGKLRKHLGVWYEWTKDENGDAMLKASMPQMIKEIGDAFEKARGHKAKPAKTPAYPGKMLKKNAGEAIQMEEYRSITGRIMYYTTKIGPEVASAVRDLSAHMSNPGEEHWKHLERCVGYLTSMPEERRSLIYRRPLELRSINYADADYAKCEDTRRSISGGINTLGGTMLTNWYSRKQPITAISTSEAEIYSYATCCQEAMFQNTLLEEIFGRKPRAAIIFEDNQGCIFMIKNNQVGQRTKHISIKLCFAKDQCQAGTVLPMYCRSEDCLADGATKAQPEKLFSEHSFALRTGRLLPPTYRTMVDRSSNANGEDVKERELQDSSLTKETSNVSESSLDHWRSYSKGIDIENPEGSRCQRSLRKSTEGHVKELRSFQEPEKFPDQGAKEVRGSGGSNESVQELRRADESSRDQKEDGETDCL